jgi:cytochrome c553
MRAVLLAGLAFIAPCALAESVEEKAQLCAICHGANGVPIDKTTPVIWGQNEGYLYLQLRDFKSGSRRNDIMSPMAASLEKDDMKALAAYFANLKWPDLQQPSAPKDVAGKAQSAISSIGCIGCHLDQFQGDGTTARLAGQQREYLEKTMGEFRDGTRGNNPGMSDLMKATPAADIGPLVQYLAGLQILGGTGGR